MTDFWTADRIETLRTMHNDRKTAREIGLALGVTRDSVIGKMHRLGLKTPVPANVWTADEIATLKRLHVESVPYPRIAAIIGRSEAACMNKAAAIGLPSRGHNTSRKSRKGVRTASWNFTPHLVVGTPQPSADLAASIVDVTGCRWAITPHDSPKDAHMFCNHPTELNEITGKPRPYCPYHSEMNRAKAVPKAEVKRFVIPTSVLRSVA